MPRTTLTLMFGTKDEEIAKLEAQLRQLQNDDEPADKPNEMVEDRLSVEDFEVARRRLEKMKGKEMILSERELQGLINGGNEAAGKPSGGILGVAGVVAVVVGLLVFAQVPIGQENLARYSATGSSNVKSIYLGDLNPDTP